MCHLTEIFGRNELIFESDKLTSSFEDRKFAKWPHTFLFSELISQLPRHQRPARSEIRWENRVWLGKLLLRSQGLCQLTPHFYIHCFLFVKRNIDLPGGQFNDPLLGKHFFLPFLPATRLSLSQTLEGLFWADMVPGPLAGLVCCFWNSIESRDLSRVPR